MWAGRSAAVPPVAFVSVPRDQRHEQLFWLTVLQSIRGTLERTHVGAKNTKSCQTAADRAIGKSIVTIEGASGAVVDAVRDAW